MPDSAEASTAALDAPAWPVPPGVNERRVLSVIAVAAALILVVGLVMPASALLGVGRTLSRDGQLGPSTVALLNRVPLFCGFLILAMSTAFAVRDLFVQDLGRAMRALSRPAAAQWGFGLFGFAALLRIAWVLLVPSVPVSDFREYMDLATRLLESGRYVNEAGVPTAFRPPGYPVFLALLHAVFGPSAFPIKCSNALVGAATCVLVWRLARTVVPEGPARLAGMMVALLPSQVGYSSLVASEVPFTALQTGALLLVAESLRLPDRRALLFGACAGLALSAAAMMRPTVALLPLVVCAVVLSAAGAKRGLPIAVALCIAFAPAPIAWGMRNAAALGAFQPFSTNGGVNFHFGNNAITNGTGLELLDPRVDATSAITDEVARNAEGWRLGAAYWRGNPGAGMVLAARKLAWLLATDGVWTRWAMISADPAPPASARGAVLVASNAAWYALLGLAGLELLLMRWRRAARDSAEPLGELMLLYTVVLTAAFIGQERYHFPMVPAMAVAAATFAARFVPPTWRTWPTPPRT